MKKNSPLESRDRLCFLLSLSILCRSQTTLGMQFSDLFSLRIENQCVTECVSLVVTITFEKTNQHGKIGLMSKTTDILKIFMKFNPSHTLSISFIINSSFIVLNLKGSS